MSSSKNHKTSAAQLKKAEVKLRRLLSYMQTGETTVERDELLRASIRGLVSEFNLDEKAVAALFKQLEDIEIGSAMYKGMQEGYRPFSIPNEKYPFVSEQSEEVVWNAVHTIRTDLIDFLDSDYAANLSEKELVGKVETMVPRFLAKHDLVLNDNELKLVELLLIDDVLLLGPLEMLMADPAVTDILVNDIDQIYVERNGKLKLCNLTFRDQYHLTHIIKKIAAMAGRRIDESTPYVDARLEDGSRVNAIIAPLAIDAPSLSIRRFGVRRINLDYLVKINSASLEMATFLSLAVRARLNIVISGGTGSGKTTLLNAMSWAIDPEERIVTIEDSAELKLLQPHVVRLETRPKNVEGQGEVLERDLVKNALRMRPDRIILGEARGAEAFDMIQAMNTGHSGSMCTVHANSPAEVASRLSNMVSMSEIDYTEDNTVRQLSNVIHIIVQVSRLRDGHRRITDISEVTGVVEGSDLQLNSLFKFEYDKESREEEVVGDFKKIVGADPKRSILESIRSGLHNEIEAIFKE